MQQVRAFYDECDMAIRSKRADSAMIRLCKAWDIMHPLIEQAKGRLEVHHVMDLWDYFQWALAWCLWKAKDRHGGREPNTLGPLFFNGLGSTYVFPPVPKHRQSLDYIWSKYKDLPESWLPSVPWRGRPYFPDKTIYEIA